MVSHARLVVEVLWGPMAYRKAIVLPGQTLVVGRTDRAGLVVPHDAHLSGTHFALSWDGARCAARDLDSARGIWIDGLRIHEAEVRNGSWLQAGQSNFMVHIEASSPPRREDAVRRATMQGEKTAAVVALRGQGASLYAVVDAARGDRVVQLLQESIDDYRSLYDGARGDALAAVAPYLVAIRRDSELLERLVWEGWGQRWGIWFTSAEPLREVRRHLRRFLVVVDDATGKRFYFRFYDPAVLRAFLPTCTPRQLQDFFGEIQRFLAEGERGDVVQFDRTSTVTP